VRLVRVTSLSAETRLQRQFRARQADNWKKMLQDVYKSESDTNQRNQAIGALMLAYGYIKDNWQQAVDLYTRQCSIGVNAKDLATMAATLAAGGKNPVTGKQVMDAAKVPGVLAVMATAGLYDDSGKWLYHTGLPPRRAASAAASSRSRRASSASPSCRRRSTRRGTAYGRSAPSLISRMRCAATRTSPDGNWQRRSGRYFTRRRRIASDARPVPHSSIDAGSGTALGVTRMFAAKTPGSASP
jgi:Glutaminase